MADGEPFVRALLYLALPVTFALGLLAPPTLPRAAVLLVGAAVVVPLAALARYRDGFGRVGADLPEPLTYLLEVLATFGVASVVTAPLPRTAVVSTGVVVVTPRTAALVVYAAATLCWLYFFGGHRRLVATMGTLRGRRRVD